METIAMVLADIVCNFGQFKILQSDRGTEFINSLLDKLKELIGFDKRAVSGYHPRANGLPERANQVIVPALKKLLQSHEQYVHWDKLLPAVQLSLNGSWHSTTASTPISLMFGRELNGFEDFKQAGEALLSVEQIRDRWFTILKVIYPAILDMVTKKREIVAERFNETKQITSFKPGDLVMMRNNDPSRQSKLDVAYDGPYKVLRITKRTGAYWLQDPMTENEHGPVAPQNMKLVSKDLFKKVEIKAHRGPRFQREYLVRFNDQSEMWIIQDSLKQDWIDQYERGNVA
jgi:hypothetical protein